MPHQFCELVIEGSFVLVKGFLMGFLYGGNKEYKYYFHRKAGIRRETFKDFLKEIFELENYVHLCLENEGVDKLLSAIEKSHDTIDLKVKSVKKIISAEFNFSYQVYNKELANEITSLFIHVKKGVELVNYHPTIKKEKDAEGIEAYAPEHHFTAQGNGIARGDFYNLLELYLNIKRSKCSESIICSEISLKLEK